MTVNALLTAFSTSAPCTDDGKHCASLVKMGYCATSDVIRNLCQKSCNDCSSTVVQICIDGKCSNASARQETVKVFIGNEGMTVVNSTNLTTTTAGTINTSTSTTLVTGARSSLSATSESVAATEATHPTEIIQLDSDREDSVSSCKTWAKQGNCVKSSTSKVVCLSRHRFNQLVKIAG